MARNEDDAERGFNHSSDSKLVFETSEDVKVVNSFDSLGLKEDLLRGIYAYSKSSSG
jgi:ATP-dependent RNA helicase